MDINLTQQDVLDMVERQIQKGLTDKLTTIIPQAVEKMLAGLGSTGALSKSSPDKLSCIYYQGGNKGRNRQASASLASKSHKSYQA